jgi:hypothetical protein
MSAPPLWERVYPAIFAFRRGPVGQKRLDKSKPTKAPVVLWWVRTCPDAVGVSLVQRELLVRSDAGGKSSRGEPAPTEAKRGLTLWERPCVASCFSRYKRAPTSDRGLAPL